MLLDEPAAGLTEAEQADLARRLRDAADSGVAVLIVEHNMPFLLPLADRILCLDEGRIIAEGTPDSVRRDPGVIAAYLGDPGLGTP
jgi:branched-chain amino acid transport system permease protein